MMTPFVQTSSIIQLSVAALGRDVSVGRHKPIDSRPCRLNLVPYPTFHRQRQRRSRTNVTESSCSRLIKMPGCAVREKVRPPAWVTSSSNSEASPPHFIDFATLANFEIVTDQFLDQGIRFENAIAIQPSNPAFPEANMGAIALIGGPKQGFTDTIFSKPIRQVEVCVTSSRSLVMTAFDHRNQALTQTETTGSNLVGKNTKSHNSPYIRLALKTETASIHQVVFRCPGGNFTLSHLSFQL